MGDANQNILNINNPSLVISRLFKVEYLILKITYIPYL